MITFREYLNEGIGHLARDAWDAIFTSDPYTFLTKLYKRVYYNNEDVSSWNKIISDFKKLGYDEEAQILDLAIRYCSVKLKFFDEFTKELVFVFYPAKLFYNEQKVKQYEQFCKRLGPPVEVVDKNTYWNKEEKIYFDIYGFKMENPATSMGGHLYPHQRSKEFHNRVNQNVQTRKEKWQKE